MVTRKRAEQGALLRAFLAGSTLAERMADDSGAVGLEPGEPYETSAEALEAGTPPKNGSADPGEVI